MNDVDLLTVVCGKEYCLPMWLDYIAKLSHKPALKKWIIVNNSGKKFFHILQREIKKRHFEKNFKYVIIHGPGKFVPPPGLDWRDKDVCLGKHRSTGESFTLGFKVCTSKYVYTLDDDVVPPTMAFPRLYNKIKLNEDMGAIAGLYFSHTGWETGNPWRTQSQLQRTVVASIQKDHWHPAMIDDYWNKGIVDSGFVGTGCTIYTREDVISCLPMKTIPRDTGLILGPDGHLCERIRTKRNKRICVDGGVVCEHWETETKQAGLGSKQFLETKLATKDVVMVGDFGNLEQRVKLFSEARDLAEKLNLKIILIWPRNKTTGWKWLPPWNTDSSLENIIYFRENEETKKFDSIHDKRRRQKKVMDEYYFRNLNSGNYRKIYNLMDTTEQVENHRHILELYNQHEVGNRDKT